MTPPCPLPWHLAKFSFCNSFRFTHRKLREIPFTWRCYDTMWCRTYLVDIRPLHLLLTACQLISHNFELMKFGCCNVQTSKFHMNLYMTSVARQQVLPDVTYFVAFWEYLWLLTKKNNPERKNFSKQKLHFHHRWKCSKNLDFQATFWQSLAWPYFCRFLSILSHMWTELSFLN